MSKPAAFKILDTDAEALALLTADQFKVFSAALLGDNYQTIAELYGLPIGTVKSRIFRARAKVLAARNAAAVG